MGWTPTISLAIISGMTRRMIGIMTFLNSTLLSFFFNVFYRPRKGLTRVHGYCALVLYDDLNSWF